MREGLSRVLQVLARGLAVRCSTPVSAIEHTDAGVVVASGDTRFKADMCIVAIPMAILKVPLVPFSSSLSPSILSP